MPLFAGKMKKSRKKAFFPLAKGTLFLYKSLRRAEVAQLVEQGTENPRVGSSILSLGTIFFLSPDVSLRAFSFPCLTSYGSLPLLLPLVVDGRASQLRLTLSPPSAVRGTFFPDMATHDTDVSRCPAT